MGNWVDCLNIIIILLWVENPMYSPGFPTSPTQFIYVTGVVMMSHYTERLRRCKSLVIMNVSSVYAYVSVLTMTSQMF